MEDSQLPQKGSTGGPENHDVLSLMGKTDRNGNKEWGETAINLIVW